MIAGVVDHEGKSYRVHANYAAVGRLAAAASLGIDGYAGQAEVSRFTYHVIDKRDRRRYCNHVRLQPGEDVFGAKCVSAIGAHAARSPDAETRQWAADLLAAIEEFRAGDSEAFTRLAHANAARAGVLLP
jgi:hypothetical protein